MELGEHLARIRVRGELLGDARGHLRQERRVQEERLRARVGLLEDLAREVVEHQLGRRGVRRAGHRAGDFRLLEDQHQAGGPALGPRVERVERSGRQGWKPLRDDRSGLIARESQRFPADMRQGAVGAQAREARRRIAATHQNRASARRQLLQRGAHHFVQRRGGRHLLVAVEDHGERRLQLREQPLEVAPREHREAGLVFGRKQRQALALAGLEIGRRKAQVIEERGDVGIAFVELVPKVWHRGVVEPARHQRGLAAAGRPGNPHRRPLAPAIEQREQARARQDPCQARARRLAERHPPRLHPGLPPGAMVLPPPHRAFPPRIRAPAPAAGHAFDAVQAAYQRHRFDLVASASQWPRKRFIGRPLFQ